MLMRHFSTTVRVTCAAMLLMAPSQAPPSSTIIARPGDVVRIDGTVTVLGRTWTNLIGIDLETKPGRYPISPTMILNVVPREFAIRRLKVSPEFVTPPPDAV